MKTRFCMVLILAAATTAFGQKTEKAGRYLGDPIVVDSATTFMIPTRYNDDFLSSNKIILSGDFFANLIFYDVPTDTSKKLFSDDTFITAFYQASPSRHYGYKPAGPNITARWIFYLVKNQDRNKNGRIDLHDPSVLYVSDARGNALKPLTTPEEHVVSIHVYEKQQFALVKVQRDANQDKNFKAEDKDFYFVKLDLNSLKFGNKVEIK